MILINSLKIPFILTTGQQSIPEAIVRSRQLPHSLVHRARIILNAAAGYHNKITAKNLHVPLPPYWSLISEFQQAIIPAEFRLSLQIG
jgi:hypothetical protein